MALQFQLIPVTHYQQNCSLVWCSRTQRAAVIDPGGDLERIHAAIDAQGVQVEQVLLTHGHMDHAGASRSLAERLSVPVLGPHAADDFWLQAMPQQALMMGFASAPPVQPDQWLHQDAQVSIGEQTLEVLHCPGHTPGHVVFFHRLQGIAWVGDVLFAGSIGRTDFPQGDHETLVNSIRQRLWPLGDHVRFIPGHGPMSTFGHERRNNPFVADQRFG